MLSRTNDLLDANPAGFQLLPGLLLQLGEKTDSPESLRNRVAAYRDALAAAGPGARRPLGAALRTLAGLTHDAAMLQEAVQASRAAVDGTPPGTANRALFTAELALALYDLYQRTGDRTTLLEAIRAGRDAVAATPPGHPNRAFRLTLLADALHLPHDPDEAAAQAEAGRCWAEALASSSAPTSLRIRAGRAFASYAVRWTRDVAGALAAYETMVALLPELAPPGLFRADREQRLARAAGIAGEAVSVAIMAGRPDRAVELLEQARSVLLSEAMAMRGELAGLRARAPALVPEFTRIRTELDALGDNRPDASRRRQLALDWEVLLAAIRAIPGLETFLVPEGISELREQAADGAGPRDLLLHAVRSRVALRPPGRARPGRIKAAKPSGEALIIAMLDTPGADYDPVVTARQRPRLTGAARPARACPARRRYRVARLVPARRIGSPTPHFATDPGVVA